MSTHTKIYQLLGRPRAMRMLRRRLDWKLSLGLRAVTDTLDRLGTKLAHNAITRVGEAITAEEKNNA